jgi:alkanesulfonate monooxygenase SsuD/methylene tetrahydromethanopterin reductase-like flavin-dependent oxidoreductase (luciferase family)
VEQSQIAEDAGFDGVTISEHHAGLFEYVPNPLMAATWILGATRRIWAAPCPLLLAIRSPLLVAEDLAWLAAKFPGRVGAGFGPGSPTTPDDFAIGGIAVDQRRRLFGEKLQTVVRALRGDAPAPLDKDPAVAACKASPVPCMSTVGGPLGARRAARLGIGLVPTSSMATGQVMGFAREFRNAGGRAPIMLNRRAWLGAPDAERIRSFVAHVGTRVVAPPERPWRPDYISSEDPAVVAQQLADVVTQAGANAVNLKFFYPTLAPAELRTQLAKFGREVVPRLKKRLATA